MYKSKCGNKENSKASHYNDLTSKRTYLTTHLSFLRVIFELL